MNNQTFSKILIVVIILILIAGGILAWQYFGTPKEEVKTPGGLAKDETADWVGVYEYSEFASPNQTWSYRLEIYKEENQLKALLDIDGFQTITRIQAIAEKRDGELDIIFDSYRAENMYESYINGDILFSLEKTSKEDYKIIWNKLRPNLIEPGDAAFRKVLTDETVDWQTYRNEEYGFEVKYPRGWLIEDHLTMISCCLNIFNSEDPYLDGVFLKSNVMKAQFQYHTDKSISSKQDYIDHEIKESEGPPDLDFPKGTINRDWISSFTTPAGVEMLEFSEGKLGNLYYVIPMSNDFSQTLHVIVWNPDVRFDQMLSSFKFTGETSQCSPIDFSGYELAKDATDTEYEFNMDLNNDGENEIVRIYTTISNDFSERVGPNMIKIFTGGDDCQKEILSYTTKGNLVWGTQTLNDLFGNGYDAILIKDASYAMGCGGTVHLLLLTYRDGGYVVINGPDYSSFGVYKLTEENGVGNKIIVAVPKWENNYCCGCEYKLQFYIYDWNGHNYVKTEAGITENKYLNESIDEILASEPSVIK